MNGVVLLVGAGIGCSLDRAARNKAVVRVGALLLALYLIISIEGIKNAQEARQNGTKRPADIFAESPKQLANRKLFPGEEGGKQMSNKLFQQNLDDKKAPSPVALSHSDAVQRAGGHAG